MRVIETEELKKLQLEILDFFVEFTEQHHLTYFLSGGTLIGAIRHHGYIPWDDDIDVMMPREDYDKMLKVFPKHDRYQVYCSETIENYPMAFATINDVRTFKDEWKFRKKCNVLCVNIDIFPIDNLPDTKEEIHLYFDEIAKVGSWVFCATYKYRIEKSLYKTIRKNIGILLYRMLEALNLTTIRDTVKKYERISQKYNHEKHQHCGVTSTYHYGEKEANLRKDYLPVKKVLFEGKYYNAPANYDTYLTQLYGEYMQMPPKKNQESHHTSANYWR